MADPDHPFPPIHDQAQVDIAKGHAKYKWPRFYGDRWPDIVPSMGPKGWYLWD